MDPESPETVVNILFHQIVSNLDLLKLLTFVVQRNNIVALPVDAQLSSGQRSGSQLYRLSDQYRFHPKQIDFINADPFR